MVGYVQGVLLAIPSTFVICFASDFICQELEIIVADRRRKLAIEDGSKSIPDEKTYNYRRTMIFSSVGGLLFGPMSYSRYLFLDLLLPDGNGIGYVILKTMASSFCYTPIMTAIGMASNEYLSVTGTWSSVATRLKNEFWKVLLAGYFFKVVTTLITMSFPGTNTKFAVSQVVGMVQNVFTSWRIFATLDEEKEKQRVKVIEGEPEIPEVEPGNQSFDATPMADAPVEKELAPEVTVEKEL